VKRRIKPISGIGGEHMHIEWNDEGRVQKKQRQHERCREREGDWKGGRKRRKEQIRMRITKRGEYVSK